MLGAFEAHGCDLPPFVQCHESLSKQLEVEEAGFEYCAAWVVDEVRARDEGGIQVASFSACVSLKTIPSNQPG